MYYARFTAFFVVQINSTIKAHKKPEKSPFTSFSRRVIYTIIVTKGVDIMYNPALNPMLNPYMQNMPGMPSYQTQAQREEVTKVNGENGARSYQIGPNSSALLLDESGLLVWLITTDGAGYKTVSPYDISPHKTAPSPDFTSLEERIARLEALYNGNTGNSGAARSSEAGGSGQLVVPVDE